MSETVAWIILIGVVWFILGPSLILLIDKTVTSYADALALTTLSVLLLWLACAVIYYTGIAVYTLYGIYL